MKIWLGQIKAFLYKVVHSAPSTPLSELQHQQLEALGWQLPEGEGGNYQLSHKVDSERGREALAQLLATTAQTVYGVFAFREEALILESAL